MRTLGHLAFSGILAAALAPACLGAETVRLAYFHGGKSYLLYRAYVDGYFEREGVRLELRSRFMGKPGFHPVPASFQEMQAAKHDRHGRRTYFGKVSGTEIAEALAGKDFDGGTMGESSFLMAVSQGAPLVAVAMLGHDTRQAPAKAIVLRKGLRVDKPADLRGRTLISRRGGPGEAVMLREFLLSAGLRPGVDVKIIDQVEEDETEPLLQDERVDGGLYHVSTIRRLLRRDAGWVYRRMDWMAPELSHGLLVFRKDFVAARRGAVVRVLRAYAKRVRFEKSLPAEARSPEQSPDQHGETGVEGMDLPQTDDPPRVRAELLDELQKLFLKHGLVREPIPYRDCVDTTLLDEALAP
jgi:ABC-type nitrate/sulfonate/bicarbonate transport system substrate-binding protein